MPKSEFIPDTQVDSSKSSETYTLSDAYPWLRDCFFLKDGKRHYKVNYGDINFIKVDNTNTVIHLEDRIVTLRVSLENFLLLLKSNIFYRVHRGYVVNLHKITTVSTYNLTIGEQEIPLGKTYRRELLQLLNIA